MQVMPQSQHKALVCNETAICPVCESIECNAWTPHTWAIPSHAKTFTYYHCKECRTVFCHPMPSSEELGSYYANNFNYGWYERRLLLKKTQAIHRWRRMNVLFKKYQIQSGNLMDIGCGHGLFVQAASHSNWDAKGLDYPSKATAYAKNVLGLNIIEDELTAAVKSGKVRQKQFDFITAWHCLEHSSKPIEFLSFATKLLKPGGKLLLAVPNVEAHGMKQRRESWVWCQEPFIHLVHYNAGSLRQAAKRAGLNVISEWSRDNWDANRHYDEGVDVKVRNISNRLNRISSKMAFGFEEGSRLLFYGFGCAHHWLLGDECTTLDGSELLLLAERPYKS